MKLTKCCMYPWNFMQIHAGGMMQPCAVGPDTDLGDFIIDYIEKKKNGAEEDFLNNEGLQMLRKGMLTGNLRPMCRECFFVSNDLIPVQEFEIRLKEYLASKLGSKVDLDTADLTKIYAYNWMAISFTNRCNLSCIYCTQSTQKDKNPYFKAEIPYEYAEDILDMMADKGISRISTCVEGEATLYRNWQEIFSWFHKKYPKIELYMTTNLNRRFSERDMELLAGYTMLDVSIDSLDPAKYASLRRNGSLELLLENLDKLDKTVKALGIRGPEILLHMVVSDQTWMDMEKVADFAYERGYGIQLGNYEERLNTVAYQEHLLKPVELMNETEQNLARDAINRIRTKAEKLGKICVIQGDIFDKIDKNVERMYHRFTITDSNPVYEEFIRQFPNGTEEKHFEVVYDRDNVSYAGIWLKCGESIHLEGLPENLSFVVREVDVYEEGKNSSKYKYPIAPGYRKIVTIEDGTYSFMARRKENVEAVLLEVCEYWSR